jgi:glycosyltransferase involved in cell wall biosynthesis
VKVRVLHLITRLELGGAQQNTLFCVESHDRERFEVALLAGAGGELDDQALAVSDARVDLVPWLKHPIAPLHDLAAVWRLAVTLRRSRADVVHTHSSKAGILGRIAARLAGVRCVVHTVHGWSFNAEQSRFTRALYVALERLAARVTDRLVVVSESDRRKGAAHRIGRPERYRLLRSGIDAGLYRAPTRPRERVREELGFGGGDIVVGTLACLKPQKAPLDFIETARTALAIDRRMRFFIAGDGPERAAVEARIAAAGLGDAVKLLGWRRDVPDLLHAMDIFLLTSRFEGLPRAVLQAMAAGVAVVATEVDGTPEVVHDGETGLLVPPACPEIAARRVVELGGDPALRERLSVRARALLGAEFDLERMVRALERDYLELLAHAPPAQARTLPSWDR